MNNSLRHLQRVWFVLVLGALVLLLAACGGAASGTPTPIPADVVRPEQPTPVYSTAQPLFRIEQNSTIPPVFAATIAPVATAPPDADAIRAELLKAMLMNLPPSAMGIATGGATIYAEPNGSVVASLPAGGALTVTGRSQDGNWLAVYTSDAITGWVSAGSLRLFGDDDLEVVTNALSPAPVATMIAEAMLPATLLIADVIATRAAAPPTPSLPAPSIANSATLTESIAANDAAQSDVLTALIGTVQTQGNLNLRAAPDATSAIVAPLAGGSPLAVLARTPASDWLQVRTPLGDGWVNAQFVALEGDLSTLPASGE
jgi:uncharacterized protein YraI